MSHRMKSSPCLSKASLGCASKTDAANVQNLLAVLTFCLLLCQDKSEGQLVVKAWSLVQSRFELG